MIHLIENVIVLVALVWAVFAAALFGHGVWAECSECERGDDL